MKTVVIDGKAYPEVVDIGPIVLIRTENAGVHFGTLASHKGKDVVLNNARRLWSWQGACSLSQVAMDGVNLSGSKISVQVPKIILTEAIEIISMSEEAGRSMMGAEAWKK